MHGWIILDKPVGLGSTQSVAAVKRNLRQAGFGKVKVAKNKKRGIKSSHCFMDKDTYKP